jgi:hypothetical protein
LATGTAVGVKLTGIWQLALAARTAGLMGQLLVCTAKGLEPDGRIEMPLVLMVSGTFPAVSVNVCGEVVVRSPPDGRTGQDR